MHFLYNELCYNSETCIEILCKKAGPMPRYAFIWTRFIKEFLELKNLAQNANLTFQNDADGDAGTTHPSWQVPREHHAQGANIPFGYPSL